MLRTWSYSALSLAVCLVLFSSASSSAQTTLRWRFQEGQTLNQSFHQDMKISMKVNDQNFDTAVKQTFDGVWRVGAVDADGSAEVVQQFTRVRMNLNAPTGGFDFDSQSDEQPTGIGALMAPALKAMAKARFTMKMTPQGEIEHVEVSEETVRALQSLPGAAQMGGAFTKEGLVNMVKQGSTSFPSEPLQKGGSWLNKLETELPQLGKMEAVSKLTYAGPEEVEGKSLERINVDLTTKIVPQQGGLAQVSINDQKSQGAVYFDNTAGRISHSEMLQNMNLSVTVGGNNYEQRIEQTIKIRLTPKTN